MGKAKGKQEEVVFMAAAHKGAISFGLVHIPVALHTATQDVNAEIKMQENAEEIL